MAVTDAHMSYPQTDKPMTLADGTPLEPLPWVKPAPDKDGKPIKLTPKQSAFVAYYLAMGNQAQAYAKAYGFNAQDWDNNALNVEASRLRAHPKVSLTIDYYLGVIADQYEITAESVTRMLVEAHTMARQQGDVAEQRQTALALAKFHGLLIEKRETKSTTIDLTGDVEAIRAVFEMVRDDREALGSGGGARVIEAEAVKSVDNAHDGA